MTSMVWLLGLVSVAAPASDVPAAGVAPVVAEATGELPVNIRRGHKRVSFGLASAGSSISSQGPTLGGGYFFLDKWAVTVQAGVTVDRQWLLMPSYQGLEKHTEVVATLAPGVRYYAANGPSVSAFVAAAVCGRYLHLAERQGQTNIGTGTVRGDGGMSIVASFGAEWWALGAFSLSGELGLALDVIRENDQPAPALRTVATALQANFYW